MAHDDISLERLAAQVEITVFEAQFLVYIRIAYYLKRRSLSLCKDPKVSNEDLNVSCLEVGVLALTLANLALSHENILASA